MFKFNICFWRRLCSKGLLNQNWQDNYGTKNIILIHFGAKSIRYFNPFWREKHSQLDSQIDNMNP